MSFATLRLCGISGCHSAPAVASVFFTPQRTRLARMVEMIRVDVSHSDNNRFEADAPATGPAYPSSAPAARSSQIGISRWRH